MVTDLMLLPLRLSVSASRRLLRTTEDATVRALGAAGQIKALVLPGDPNGDRRRGAEPLSTGRGAAGTGTPGGAQANATWAGPTEDETVAVAPEPDAVAQVPEPKSEPPVFEGPEPPESREPESHVSEEPEYHVSEEPQSHVSEEPELVRDVAEAGAEDGAGASVTVAEPWDGYARMSASEVIDRLGDATTAELAAIELYETANRNRRTVLTAAEGELKRKSGRGSVNLRKEP